MSAYLALMLGLIVALQILLSPVQIQSDHVRFVVTGDDRWNTKSPRPGMDENGVNVTGLGRVIKAVIDEKPDALLINGDLVGGAETDDEESSQFETWFKAMQPAYDAGIKVLPVRGNHEMHCPGADAVWRKAMSGAHAVPQNGPAGEEGLSYTYPLKNVLFIALDEFKTKEPVVNQTWLDSVLSAPHPPHVFAFGHKMAFFSGNHTDGMWSMMPQRDKLIDSLKNAGSRVVFFGHDHLYDHAAVKRAGWTDDQAIHQYVIGTAGAPFVKGKILSTQDGDWSVSRIKHIEGQLGYCLVDVEGSKVTLTYKTETAPGVFEAADTYSYTTK